MLDILLLVLQIVTLILLFLFIWWVVHSARRDLSGSAQNAGAAVQRSSLSWNAGDDWSQGTSAGGAHADVWPDASAGGADAGWSAPRHDAPRTGWSAAALTQAAATAATGTAPTRAAAGHAGAAHAGESTDWGWSSETSGVQAPFDHVDASGSHAGGSVAGPRLIVESSPLLTPGQEIPIEDGLGIGRVAGNGIVLGEPFVSSRHAQVVYRDGSFHVEDLGSTNGTFVNERRITEAPLAPETRLRVGETVFRYEE